MERALVIVVMVVAVMLPSCSSDEQGQSLPTGGTPVLDFAGAVPGDDGADPLALGTVDGAPNNTRLDFLFEFCPPSWPECHRDAHFMHPEDPLMGSGTWTEGRPFHVRHGFINDGDEPLGEGFDLVLYATRLNEYHLNTAAVPSEPTYRYTADYVLRGTADQCGPTYKTQTEPATCEWFVHDFPLGLPEGRWAMWALWEAPCSTWVDLGLIDSCEDPDEVSSLFSSGFDAPFGPGQAAFDEVNEAQLTPDELEEILTERFSGR